MRPSVMRLTLTLLASACSSAGGTPVVTDTTAATEDPEPIDLNDLAEALFIDEAEHFQIERAIHACMTDAGFEYNISPYWRLDMFEDAEWREVADPSPTTGPDQAEEDAYRELRSDISRAKFGWEDAFFGTGSAYFEDESGAGFESRRGGCLDGGREAVVGDVDAWDELMFRTQNILGEAYVDADAASAALIANDAWVSCMRARGFDASSPDDFEFDGQEESMALEALGECMDESGLDTVVREEQVSTVGALLQQNARTLSPLLAVLTDQTQQ